MRHTLSKTDYLRFHALIPDVAAARNWELPHALRLMPSRAGPLFLFNGD
jgi:hypothetical protein